MTDPAPLTDEELEERFAATFYLCPNTGDWVYRWSDERMVLVPSADLRAARAEEKRLRLCAACDEISDYYIRAVGLCYRHADQVLRVQPLSGIHRRPPA